ncbi:hypothetical protein HK099_003953 [Clydaea vesicula]|uniref:Uncharacterized protein n=1 Tax=Clydaea vesicula TaxID=447962 RepID=A0AAD5U0Z6_9FUNG|nr:hypothetical protein HK099_003953 [Clydaea vesicula]
MFSTNLIALCPVEPIGILKHCPEDPDAKFQEEIFENILKNTQSYVIDVFIAYGCLRSKHPILFQPEFGGSPLCVGIYYLNKAIETLKILPANERYRIEALQSMFGVSCLLFYFGKKNDGLFWLTEVYKAAQHFNFDRPTAVLEDLDLFTVKTEEKVEPTEEEKEALIEKKQRRLLWARTMEILALVTSPLIGTEEEHFYMIDEQQWELIGVKRLVNSAYDVVDLTIEMQLCFLYRRSIRYVQAPIEETILQNDISKIHVALVSWHENIPKSMRTFDSLTDFIDGTRVFPECDWIDNAYNLSSNCWFLLALIKIHSHNNLFNPNQRFKFSENFPVDGTSLDFILVCFRALTSILLITLPKELELKLNSDERPFLYNIAVDILLTVTLHETIQIAVDCLKKGLGWALNLKLRQEVINLHLDRIYLKILKERNNPFSQSSYDMLIPIVETLKRDDINGIEISDGSVEGSINGSSTLGISEVFD